MAELTPQERLQPALLDRLIDEEPEKSVESREQRVLTKTQLRAAVLRDLAWLLNTTRLTERSGLAGYSAAENSVLNYGMPSFSGETAAALDITDLERAIREAIVRFEPRILPATLRVEARADGRALDWHNVVNIIITGQLWAQPVPIELLLRTEVDLETGQVQLNEIRSAA